MRQIMYKKTYFNMAHRRKSLGRVMFEATLWAGVLIIVIILLGLAMGAG
jgi:hypothetical protein